MMEDRKMVIGIALVIIVFSIIGFIKIGLHLRSLLLKALSRKLYLLVIYPYTLTSKL